MTFARVRAWFRSLKDRLSLVFVSRLIWLVGQVVCRSLRYSTSGESQTAGDPGRVLITWHHLTLLPIFHMRHRDYHAIVSLSRHGEHQSRVLDHFGWSSIRGSSRKGQLRALRQAARCLEREGTVAVTPDGPLGPSERCQPGCVYLALTGGAPIIPVGTYFERCWRLPTWDGYMIPVPFTRAHVHYGGPLRFHGDRHTLDIEQACREVEKALAEAIAVAKQAVEEAGRETATGSALGETAVPRPTPPLLPWIVYNLGLAVLFPLVVVFFLHRYVTRARARPGLLQRLGIRPTRVPREAALERVIWIHAVSVGEVGAARPVIEALKDYGAVRVPVSVSTATGYQVAESQLEGLADHLFYFPLDFPFSVAHTLNAVRPDAVLLVEGEIWPNLIHECKRRGIPVMVFNGRVSDRTLSRSRLVGPVYRWALKNLDLLCMQTARDCRRIEALGADPERVKDTGNTKFDSLLSPVPEAVRRQLLLELRLRSEDKIFLAGSTHQGEEEVVLDAYWQARVQLPDLRLIIAPRHVERADEVEQLITAKGFRCVRRTQLPKGMDVAQTIERALAEEDDPQRVILVDTMGELANLYGICTVAFAGKSLRPPGGGQNPLEPVAQGKAVLFGPMMSNFPGPRDLLLETEVGYEVGDATEMAEVLARLCSNPARLESIAGTAERLIGENRGAAARCASYAMRLLGEAEVTA